MTDEEKSLQELERYYNTVVEAGSTLDQALGVVAQDLEGELGQKYKTVKDKLATLRFKIPAPDAHPLLRHGRQVVQQQKDRAKWRITGVC